MSETAYRSELDGVRGLSIIVVVLFHAGFPSFQGGYIGVDVFFVLSGYLIVGQTYPRLQNGTFSASDFFARRIRRLAPAYGVCFIAVALAANALYLRSDMQVVAENFLGSITFTNNFNLMGSAGYFAGPNAENPFLHTWTLSIEEQFYIVMPLLILLTMRNAQAFVVLLIIVFMVSLSLSLFSTDQIYTKDERYFSTLYRVWQIAAGGLAFLLMHYSYVPARLPVAPLLGTVMILVPVFVYDSNDLYPSWIALFPVMGTVLLLLFGSTAQSWTGRAFAVRPMVYIGKISYGMYLWHWPLIVGVVYYGIRMTDEIRTVIFIASIAMGALSYHLIETPVRRISVRHKKQLFIAFGGQCAVMLALAFYLFQQPGKADVGENAQVLALQNEVMNFHPGWSDCWGHTTEQSFCRMGVEKDQPDFFLWGDSMANSAFVAFDKYGRARNQAGRLATSPGCAPVQGVAHKMVCLERNDQILDYLDQAEPMDVFMMSRWSYLAEGFGHFGEVPGRVPLYLADGSLVPDNFPAFVSAMERSFARVAARHNLIIIMTIPKYDTSIPKAMLRNLRFGAALPEQTREAYDAREMRTNTAVLEMAQRYGAQVIAPQDVFCATGLCVFEEEGVPLYMDQVHLSPAGNDKLLEILFDEMGGAP